MRVLFLILLALLQTAPAMAAIKFTVTHTDANGGWTDPTLGKARRDTLQLVFDYLNTVLDASGTIDIRTGASDYNATGPIASAPTAFLTAPNGFSSGNAFIHANTGVDPNPASADITITVDWGYALSPGSGQPPPGQIDLFTVLLHEVTHGLGFLTRIKGDGKSAITNTNPGVYTVMDSFDRIGNVAPATPLFANAGNYTAAVADLSDFSPGIFYWGPEAMKTTAGKPLKLFQSNPHTLGSGLSHTGQLMGPSLSTSEIYRKYSVRDLGMLRDMGWKIKPQTPGILGTKTLTMLNDPVPENTFASNDLNEGLDGGRFRGILGGLLLEEYPNTPRRVWNEDPSTAGGGGRTATGGYTQINHPDARGAILLENLDGRHSATGLTWISPSQNFQYAARPDEKFVFSYRVNPTPAIPGAGRGTYIDAVMAASEQAIQGGAAFCDGIGFRLNVSGPRAGDWEIFDGTDHVNRSIANGPLPPMKIGFEWYAISIEMLQPSFDGSSPATVNVLINGSVVHTFTTAGSVKDNFVSFHAGPAAGDGSPAAYLIDDINLSLEPWLEAPAVVTISGDAPHGIAGAPYTATFLASGGNGSYDWFVDGQLPPGLTFSEGSITGAAKQTGSFPVTLHAVDEGFFVGTRTVEIVIEAPTRNRIAR